MSFAERAILGFAIFYAALWVMSMLLKWVSYRVSMVEAKRLESSGLIKDLQNQKDQALKALAKANDMAARLKFVMQEYQAEIYELNNKLARAQPGPRNSDSDEIRRLQDEIAHLKLLLSGYTANPVHRQSASAAGLNMDSKTLDRLIRLCHPDKHNGSAMATEATQWLLKERDSLKRRKA